MSDRHLEKAREVYDDVLHHGMTVGLERIATALAEAEREGMRRAAEIAKAIDGDNTTTFATVKLAEPYDPKPFIGTKPLGLTIAESILSEAGIADLDAKADSGDNT